MRQSIFTLCVLLTIILLAGCSTQTDTEVGIEKLANHKGIKEELKYGNIEMKFELLDGEDIRSFSVKKNKDYNFELEYLITEGSILLQFRDSENKKIEEIKLSQDEYIYELKELEKEHPDGENIQIEEIGKSIKVRSIDKQIKIALIGDKAKGKVNIRW